MKKLKREFIKLKLEEIIPYENNNKIHTDKDVWELVKSIEKDWYISPIVVDENNLILAGHWRTLALEKIWFKKVEVVRISWLDELQKRDYRIRDNTTALLADFHLENLIIDLEWLWYFSSDII